MLSKKQLDRSRTGFTIIEVVLVLAIAGLIFLMVFVALPALQRSQRDTQRRQDVSRVASALTQYQTNNGGNLPGSWTDKKVAGTSLQSTTIPFRSNYLSDLKNQSGTAYALYGYKLTESYLTTDGGKPIGFSKLTTSDRINIYSYASCGGEIPVLSSGARDFAVVLKLEGAGYYCLDNK